MTTHSNHQSRMFRTIVLMGSSLALGCGGKAAEQASSSAGSAGGSTGTGLSSGGTASAAAGSAAGGAGSGGAGLLTSGGGTISISVGSAGSPAGGTSASAGSGGMPDCPPAEWTCTGPTDCSYDTGWVPGACKCDPSHPLSSSACQPGQVYACLSTGNPAHGFQCWCVPSNGNCSEECASAFGPQAGYTECDLQTQPGTILCGCAVVLLK